MLGKLDRFAGFARPSLNRRGFLKVVGLSGAGFMVGCTRPEDAATVDEVAKSITDVLALVDQLQAADTEGVAPMAHPLDATQRLRADQVSEDNRREAFQELAPAAEQGLYLVPKVIE